MLRWTGAARVRGAAANRAAKHAQRAGRADECAEHGGSAAMRPARAAAGWRGAVVLCNGTLRASARRQLARARVVAVLPPWRWHRTSTPGSCCCAGLKLRGTSSSERCHVRCRAARAPLLRAPRSGPPTNPRCFVRRVVTKPKDGPACRTAGVNTGANRLVNAALSACCGVVIARADLYCACSGFSRKTRPRQRPATGTLRHPTALLQPSLSPDRRAGEAARAKCLLQPAAAQLWRARRRG